MMRGYAIGLGAGTQVFTLLPWAAVAGEPTGVNRAFLMAAGWMINLAVAEWFIRRDSKVAPASILVKSSLDARF